MTPKEYLKLPYARVFYPCEEGGFFVTILEFAGCYSQGEDLIDAYNNLEEAATSWLEACILKKLEIPPPAEIAEWDRVPGCTHDLS